MWTFCISILRCLYFFSVFFLFEFYFFFFFFQAEDGIRDGHVTGVQTCALPICCSRSSTAASCSVSSRSRSCCSGTTRRRSRRRSSPRRGGGSRTTRRTTTGRCSHDSCSRSEERRVGKEWRSRGAPGTEKKEEGE